MQLKAIFTLLTPLILLPSALAGINCEGSSSCEPSGAHLSDLYDDLDNLDQSRYFTNGQHIVCQKAEGGTGGICAFLQNTNGAPAKAIQPLIGELEDHGCKVCGSVPLYYADGDNNDGDHGILTVNFVSNVGSCQGIC